MKQILRQENLFILRFDFNEEFPNDEFFNFLKKNDISGSYFWGLGNAQYIKAGYINIQEKQYHFLEWTGSLEIANLTGEISLKENNELNVHTHLTFSNEKLEAFAGHLDKLKVGATLELFLVRTPFLKRKTDNRVGIQIFDTADLNSAA